MSDVSNDKECETESLLFVLVMRITPTLLLEVLATSGWSSCCLTHSPSQNVHVVVHVLNVSDKKKVSDIWLQFHAKEQLDDFRYLLGFSSAQNPW